jgi:carnitine O-octanoyltransferase
VEKWWEDYAYLTFRMPLIPYCSMVQPFISTVAGVEESAANSLKLAARLLHYNMIFWDLLRRERIKPTVINNGKVRLSSALYHRFYNTARIPGVEKDEIVCKFKTAREGAGITHFVVIGNGRLFKIDALTKDNKLATPQQMWYNLKLVKAELDAQGQNENSVPILTMDDRTGWAKNRLHLQELSRNNTDILEVIESCLMVVCLDNHEPESFAETSVNALTGDFHSRWADKSGAYVFFKNGKVGCISEHSCYDATVSVQYSTFMQMSLFENPEPDWDEPVTEQFAYPTELRFDVDDHIRAEIRKMEEVGKEMKNTICVVFDQYQGYGKEFMKQNKIHPDSFVQTVLQLAYYRMHEKFVATYETAMMREYCNGRTETVRSCTLDSIKFCEAMADAKESVSLL